jgi:3-phenylpropionate/trans-cinnamate dioxygenase ferredoxin reductase subunit
VSNSDGFVIVGAGLAGAKAAEALREQGFQGRLTLVGNERHRPYERPPLSKGYLTGGAERDSVFVHGESFYAEHSIELRLHSAATQIDRAAHRLALADGTELGYDKLLLTTGSEPRRLPIAGSDAAQVHYLRTLDDSEALKVLMTPDIKLAIIGAGWIGLEVAAAARQAGAEVTVVESAELPLLRVLGPEVARAFADLHRGHGVELRLKTLTNRIITSGGVVTGVELHDGTSVAADAVLVAVGVEPRARLAEEAGLKTGNGVVTDESLATSDPDVFAAGDVANAYHPLLATHVRVEHWANALKQPATAAASMMGKPASYRELPYFFTDQYDLGMEYVGYVEPGGYDRVVIRGDLEAREFIAFWTSGNRVLAAMNVNIWDVVDDLKALINSRAGVDIGRLADPRVPLGELTGA